MLTLTARAVPFGRGIIAISYVPGREALQPGGGEPRGVMVSVTCATATPSAIVMAATKRRKCMMEGITIINCSEGWKKTLRRLRRAEE